MLGFFYQLLYPRLYPRLYQSLKSTKFFSEPKHAENNPDSIKNSFKKSRPKKNNSLFLFHRHFKMNHYNNVKPARKYFCVYCSNEYLSPFYSFETVETVYGHWLSNHTEVPNALPFQFFAVDLVGCLYCPFNGLSGRLRIHHGKKHAGQPFAMARASNRQQCALCPFGSSNLVEHFQEKHEFDLKVNLCNPVCYAPETLAELLSIDIRQKRQCGHCAAVFETDHEAEIHHYTMHPDRSDLVIKWNGMENPNPISHMICTMCNQKPESNDLCEHMEQDFTWFELSNYGNYLYDGDSSGGSNEASKVYFKLLDIFLRTKVVFNNGLVVFKQNLLFSQFDDIQQFQAIALQIANSIQGGTGQTP